MDLFIGCTVCLTPEAFPTSASGTSMVAPGTITVIVSLQGGPKK